MHRVRASFACRKNYYKDPTANIHTNTSTVHIQTNVFLASVSLYTILHPPKYPRRCTDGAGWFELNFKNNYFVILFKTSQFAERNSACIISVCRKRIQSALSLVCTSYARLDNKKYLNVNHCDMTLKVAKTYDN